MIKHIKTIVLSLFLISIFLVLFLLKPKNEGSSYTTLVNKQSSCIACHTPMQGFSKAHAPNKITCISCHLGNAISSEKETAHKNMLTVPGNLSNASQTCAKCHVGIDIRVKKSIMNTMSGIISVDKYVFNENDNLDSIFNIHHLENKTLAESHLRNKCASCHIGNEKAHPNPISQKSRGGGCTACHLNYSEEGKKAHANYIQSNKVELPTIHPSLSLKITDKHCFGCHSRSGRIATNYEGWHETIYKDTLYNNPKYRVLEDTRVFEQQKANIHHTKGLSCIDCHDSDDVMGDGLTYAHQENATHTNCTDCHFSSEVKTRSFTQLSEADKRIIKLRKIDTNNVFVYSEKSKKTLINVVHKNRKNVLITKNSKQELTLTAPSSNCTKKAHQKLACSTCHTSWAPQCITCHTSLDAKEDAYDLLAKDWKMGKWLEKGGDYKAEFPTLGVVIKNGKEQVKTFAPGMLLHLETSSTNSSFHRLFAPISAHTISEKGVSCKTCHANSVALGYGSGQLTFDTKTTTWKFAPTYSKDIDNIPKDAWIAFMTNDTIAKATRTNARPFTKKEQEKILQVGVCLTCHKETSKVANAMLNSFEKAVNNRTEKCKVATFE